MRENGFLSAEWSEASLSEVLAVKSIQGLITARVDDRMTDVIALMKAHDISQMPVLHSDQSLAGLVTEVDLLKHLLENSHVHSADETIAKIVCPTQAVFPASTPLEAVLPAIMDGQVALVTEENHPVGILTKIDILDFIARGI
jgi:cystathionine beta-synthase